jgi:parallel beta-helix repeat protein
MVNKRVSLLVAYFVFVSVLGSVVTILPEGSRATVRYVGGSNPGNYTTIQDAINDSAPGDIVYVYNGTYNEHVVIDVPMSLIGEDRDTTIIDGSGSGDVVNVTANWVNISWFTIKNSGPDGGDAGIELYQVQNCHIANNTAIYNIWGIFLDSSANNTISNNSASYNRGGISLFSSSDNSIPAIPMESSFTIPRTTRSPTTPPQTTALVSISGSLETTQWWATMSI